MVSTLQTAHRTARHTDYCEPTSIPYSVQACHAEESTLEGPPGGALTAFTGHTIDNATYDQQRKCETLSDH